MTCTNADFSVLNKCRTCLGESVEVTTIEFLNLSFELVPILNFLNIKIVDELPNSLCSDCVAKLIYINSFKQQCDESQIVLQNHYKEHISKTLIRKNEISSELIEDIKVENIKQENDCNDEDLDASRNSNCVEVEILHEEENRENEMSKLKNETEKVVQNNCVDKKANKKINRTELNVCVRCNKRFTYKKSLIKHGKTCKGSISGEKTITSDSRKEIKSELNNVQKLVINDSFSCKKCKFSCDSKEQLDDHSQNKHDTVCNICNRKFFNHQYLRQHREIHRADRQKLLCEICKKFYDSKSTLYVHKRKFHSGNIREKTVCTLCGLAVFKIKQHLKNRHPDPDSKFRCSRCDKEFKSQVTLRYHEKMYHETPKLFNNLCPECGKLFRTAGEVRYHILRVHSNHASERNYQCKHCEKTFKTSTHCFQHERAVHLNVRKYNCKFCSKAFSSKSVLVNHIRTHTGEKPFVCDLCKRSFAQKVALRTHLKLVHGLEVKQFYLKTKPVTNDTQMSIENE